MRDLIVIESFAPGFSNKREATRLRQGDGSGPGSTFLHAADNVDLGADGFLRRRRGYALALAGSAAHSLWSDGADAFYADGPELIHLDAGLTRTTLRTELAPQQPLSYVRAPDGDVYWSNGLEIGRIHDGQARPIITPAPTAPTVSATAGSLPAGRYQVAFTSRGPDGESPATYPIAVTLPANGGIALGPLAPGMCVYMTAPDGDVLTRVPDPLSTITMLANTGERLQTLLMSAMPAGTIVRHYAGRLLVAYANFLCLSEPYQYGLTNPARNWLPFPEPISVVEPCEDGIYLCADATYWIPGDPMDTSPTELRPYGALAGSSSVSPDQRLVAWMSDQGIVVGAPGGQITTPQSDAISFGQASYGWTGWREQGGQTHILAAPLDAAPPTNVARSFAAAETRNMECN